MKTIALLAVVLTGSVFVAPQAHAGKVGKLAGTYNGSGTITDTSNPLIVYKYSFVGIAAKVKGNGKISGSATAIVTYSTNGGPFLPITTQTVSVKGTTTDLSATKTKISATGELEFSEGTDVTGKFSANAKTGKGKYLIKDHTGNGGTTDVEFKLTKVK